MYPTKSILDYMTEMNRLFPRNDENDIFQSPPTSNPSLRSYNQSLARSSSSTDTSPDSFPDMTAHHFPPDFHQYESFHSRASHEIRHDKAEMQDRFMPQLYETPIVMRRHRPIMGRKIMASDSQVSKTDFNTWPETLQQTPPNYMEQTKPNSFYELFPETKTEFRTPVKTPPRSYNMSPNITNVSPRMLSPGMMNISPRMKEMSSRMPEMSPWLREMSPKMPDLSPRMPELSARMPETSPNTNTSSGSSAYSPRLITPFKEPIIGPGSSLRQTGAGKLCTFCRKNGETPLVYMTHTVKEKVGQKNVVTCPILRSHVCATCRATGDNAHTITYCPVLRSTNNGQPLQSTTITLKNTRVKSNGRRRY